MAFLKNLVKIINKEVSACGLIIKLIFDFFEEPPLFIIYKGVDLATLYWATFFSLFLVNKAFLGTISAKIK